MKSIFLLSLLIFPFSCSAIEATCYSYGNLIYHGNVHNISYNDDYYLFTEDSKKHEILLFGDCMFKADSKTLKKKK